MSDVRWIAGAGLCYGLRRRPVCASPGALLPSEQFMSSPFEHLQSLNRLVHEPARLAILVALSACDKADFLFLLNITGLTKGNLSSHLSKLADAGLVEIEKTYEGKTPI